MSSKELPTICPECHKPGVTYSAGVIPCKLGIGHDYPVVRCGNCRLNFFLPPPYDSWKRCQVNSLIAFTKDPDAIDRTITLAYRFELVAGGRLYWIDPVS